MKKVTILFLIVLTLSPINLFSKTIFVSKTGNNSNGASWTNAYQDLQTAIISAQSGDKIWVSAGTYYPSNLENPNDIRTQTFKLKSGVEIYGGFKGNESTLSQRSIENNRTYLSGSTREIGNSQDCNCLINNNNNGVDSSAVLDGFYLVNSFRNKDTASLGTLMININTSPKIRNCIIIGTHIKNDIIYLNNSNSIFENCRFMYYYAEVNSISSNIKFINCSFEELNSKAINARRGKLELIDCQFLGNLSTLDERLFAYDNANAVYMLQGELQISNCEFTNYRTLRGGAVYVQYIDKFSVDKSLFQNNQSIMDFKEIGDYPTEYFPAGAITIFNATEKPVINNCRFENNESQMGGAISSSADLLIKNSFFISNKAEDNGSAVAYFIGENNYIPKIEMINCVVYDNESKYGSALYGNFTLRNCSVSGNKSESGCGAIDGMELTGYNSIIYQNKSENSKKDITAYNLHLYNCLVSQDTNFVYC